jgi:branched-chain amino acid transport system permease protein
MRNARVARLLPLAMLFLVLLALPMVVTRSYYMHIVLLTGYYMLLALSVNLVTGFTGNLFLAAAAFSGIGAYASALLTMKWGFPFWLALPAAGFVAAVFGFVLGYPCLRLIGPYFSIATFGFGEITRLVFVNWYSVTNGPLGIRGIPGPGRIGIGPLSASIDSRLSYYYLLLGIILISTYVLYRIINSHIGRAFWAIRSETFMLAQMIGINATKIKIYSFMVTAFFCGMAGSFYAHYMRFISPDTFVFPESAAAVAMAVVGGMGTITGPIIGAILLGVSVELLRVVSQYRMVVYGLVMIVSVLFMPEGLVGVARRVFSQRRRVAAAGVPARRG